MKPSDTTPMPSSARPGRGRLDGPLRWALLALGLLMAACGARQQHAESARNEASADILLEHADASQAVGDMTRAEQYYVAAREAGAPEQIIIRRLLLVCVADRRYPVAAQYAEQFLRRHPNDTDIQFAAASIQSALGEHGRARALLEEVVKRQPRRAEAHYALASVLREREPAGPAADEHDLAYLTLEPQGPLAEAARARLTRRSR
jgi:tetratricopeptide (TPR) repeat protein